MFKFKLGAREPEQGWFDGTMLLSIARKIVRLLLVITIAAAPLAPRALQTVLQTPAA